MENKKNRRILIIDDNRAIHRDFRKILDASNGTANLDAMDSAVFYGDKPALSPETERYSLDSAFQGNEGFVKVRQSVEAGNPYALVFVDMDMPPGWDGIETIEKIIEIDSEIQIVISTAQLNYSREDILSKFGRADRVVILKKPFDMAEVFQIACALTEKWNLARRAHLKVDEFQGVILERTDALLAEATEQRRSDVALQSIKERYAIADAAANLAEEKLRHNALHDSLTGLANRTMLMVQINQCMQRALRLPDYTFAVLFLDLDRFKLINDSLGHEAGDQLLKEIAARLLTEVRGLDTATRWPEDIVARPGGDEFVLVLDTIRLPDDAAPVAERVLKSLAKPILLNGQEVVISASIGIVIISTNYERAEDILRDADTALYHAKHEGKGRPRIFDTKMHDEAVKRLWMETELRQAIHAGELTLHYQPILSAVTGKVVEVEALVRWQHPQRGLIPPCDFIPLAEETGLIVPLGNWVLEAACRQVREWDATIPEFADIVVAVNVSGRQLVRPEFVAEASEIIERDQLERHRFKIEITESALIESGAAATATLNNLREAGLKLHLDDFGSGYSSLSYLHRLPFEWLKIDRSFVMEMATDDAKRPIVEAIVALGRLLGMKVVAEGVENAEHVAFLRELGCDFLQGYYFSRPLPADEAAAYVQQTNQNLLAETDFASGQRSFQFQS